jgi:hypothetical protein
MHEAVTQISYEQLILSVVFDYLERGAAHYFSRWMGKSSDCLVANGATQVHVGAVKTNSTVCAKRARILSRRSGAAHDRWLVLNLQQFNFASGWRQMLARQQAQQFSR